MGVRQGGRSRRISPSWLLLLAGAILAILAIAGPVLVSTINLRRIAIEAYPSAELAAADQMAAFREQLLVFLRRLDDDDLVRMGLPTGYDAPRQWLTAREASDIVKRLKPSCRPAATLRVQSTALDAQHTYSFGVGEMPAASRDAHYRIVIQPASTNAGICAIGAAANIAENATGDVDVFVAVRNNTSHDSHASIVFTTLDPDGQERSSIRVRHAIKAGSRKGIVQTLGVFDAVEVTVLLEGQKIPVRAWIARRPGAKVRVAVMGPDDPNISRYIRSDPAIQPVQSPRDADVVIASGAAAAPLGAAAIVISPRRLPQTWRKIGARLNSVSLANWHVPANDPVTRGVDFSDVAIRQAVPWRTENPGSARILLGKDGDALIVRSAADIPSRRIWVAFNLSELNSTFARSTSFVVFMANAIRWLHGSQTARAYESLACTDAPRAGKWSLIRGGDVQFADGMAAGLYRDQQGSLRAVNLLHPGTDAAMTASAQTPRDVHLPAAQAVDAVIECWWWLLAIACVLWLAGWSVREA